VPCPLPADAFAGTRYVRDTDRPAIRACHQRAVEHGQCDIERGERVGALLRQRRRRFEVIDRPTTRAGAGIHLLRQFSQDGKDLLRVHARFADDVAALRGSWRSSAAARQYHAAVITLRPTCR